jgi:hypothetical protein
MSAPDSIFHHRSFVVFCLSQVCASVAVQMQSLAVGWQTDNLTGFKVFPQPVGIKSVDGFSPSSPPPAIGPYSTILGWIR